MAFLRQKITCLWYLYDQNMTPKAPEAYAISHSIAKTKKKLGFGSQEASKNDSGGRELHNSWFKVDIGWKKNMFMVFTW